MESLGGKIKSLRKQVNMTQTEFAKRIGVAQGFLSTIERGESAFSTDVLIRIRDEFGINLDSWVSGGSAVARPLKSDAQPEGQPKDLAATVHSAFQKVRGRQKKQTMQVIPTADPTRKIEVAVLLSPVKAGFPSWMSDDIEAKIDISKIYNEHTYYVRATGDSMIGARIQEGDMLLVDESREAQNGDLVLADVDGEKTVKRLKKNGQEYLLHPDSNNPEYKPIPVDEKVQIIAVVVRIEISP